MHRMIVVLMISASIYSLSLCQQLNTKLLTNVHENFASDVSVDKEELVTFSKFSASGTRSRNF